MANDTKSTQYKRPAGSVEVREKPPEPDDFFKYENKDPNFHYHWAKNDPRRIQQMKRDGYEVDQAQSSNEAARAQVAQRNLMRTILDDPNRSEKDKVAAKEVLNQLEVTPRDTVVNIPEHIIMKTSMANWKKRQEAKQGRLKHMEDQVQQNLQDFTKALKRSGLGGIKEFKDMWDKVK